MKDYRTKTAENRRKLRKATDKVFSLFDSTAQFAQLLGASRQVVHNWKVRGQIPVERVASVSKLTEIPAEGIRPDIFTVS